MVWISLLEDEDLFEVSANDGKNVIINLRNWKHVANIELLQGQGHPLDFDLVHMQCFQL